MLLERVNQLGVGIIPLTMAEVTNLGATLLSIGAGRILALADNHRRNTILGRSGFEILAVEVDQFTRCGGGPVA